MPPPRAPRIRRRHESRQSGVLAVGVRSELRLDKNDSPSLLLEGDTGGRPAERPGTSKEISCRGSDSESIDINRGARGHLYVGQAHSIGHARLSM
jgi:hypothetical protein